MSNKFNLFGDIVANDADRWFDSDVTPQIVIGWLNKQTGDVEIDINSNGGSVTAGLAIANAIKAYNKGEVTCNVLGVAASMASVIACAGAKLRMGQGSFLMIHNPWTVTMGDADELRNQADVLDKMRDSILGFYQSKTDMSADELKSLMDAESWINYDEAKAFNFAVEEYGETFAAAASITRRQFDKAPEAARAFYAVTAKPAETIEANEPIEPGEPGEPIETPATPETPETPAAPAPDPQNWEARFKGLSSKYNDLQKRSIAEIAAITAERDNYKNLLDEQARNLAEATAKVSELGQLITERDNALQKASEDLAATRDSLKSAEDKAKKLEETRDLLTAGVLSPAPEASYAAKMKTAKTPEEREALRAKKASGKIK